MTDAPEVDREALRATVEGLEDELARAHADVERLREELAEARAEHDERVAAEAVRLRARRARRTIALAVGVALVVAGAVTAYVLLQWVEQETLAGRVVAVEGPAPARDGETCTLLIEPVALPGPYNAWLRVDCGRQRIYGYDSFGHLRCETVDGRAVRCVDEDTTTSGGDPRLSFDRASRSLRIDDGRRWSFEVALDEPSAGR